MNRVFSGNVKNVYAVGDLHGDYESFSSVIQRHKKPEKDSLLLFLGDYADRGLNGVEIITVLNRILDSRKDIIALKGNHEIYKNKRPVFTPCDLIYEVETKYHSWEKFYSDIMAGFFEKLYIAAVINRVLFVHAGISSGIKSVKDLLLPENEEDLLWSDPSRVPGEHPNMRGAGTTFGEDITTRVLSSLGVKIVVRSHEPRKAAGGPFPEHSGQVITTNTCTSYGGHLRPFIFKINTETTEYEPIFL
jgi:hypothetical protein